METTTHHRRAETATEKRSLFKPHRGLAAPDLFLDTMLTGEHGRHAPLTVWKPWVAYGNGSRHVTRRVKLIETLNWESLFIPSRLSSCQSMNSPVGVNLHGSMEKVKLLLNGSHLEPQAVKLQRHRGDDDLE
jgi:hypothetical protein